MSKHKAASSSSEASFAGGEGFCDVTIYSGFLAPRQPAKAVPGYIVTTVQHSMFNVQALTVYLYGGTCATTKSVFQLRKH